MVTVQQKIINYLKKVPYSTTAMIKSYMSRWNAESTVQHTLTDLVDQGIIERPVRGVYYLLQLIYRHYLSVLAYCHGKKQQFYALTFKDDDEDIEQELFNKIIEETIDMCGNHEDTGYEITENQEGMNDENTYPEIEVGRL